MDLLSAFRANKKQEEKEKKVSKIVHKKKNEFTTDMLKLQNQSKRVHATNLKALQESKKLNDLLSKLLLDVVKSK